MDHDIDQVVETNIAENINRDILSQILSSAPFVTIKGTFNARDLSDGCIGVRPGYAFRTAPLERLCDEGKKAIVELGVKVIFDLRSRKEKEDFPDPEIPGIELVWQPSTWDDTTRKARQGDTGEFSFSKMYMDMLESHKPSFRTILTHIRDHPDQPFIFHCTAGKDRTGLMAAIILGLAEVPVSYIDHDYALTRVGIDQSRSFLVKKLMGGGVVDFNNPVIQAYANVPTKLMLTFSDSVEEKYGGFSAYVKKELEFSDAEIEQIRQNLKSC